jgi:hypothetical protein
MQKCQEFNFSVNLYPDNNSSSISFNEIIIGYFPVKSGYNFIHTPQLKIKSGMILGFYQNDSIIAVDIYNRPKYSDAYSDAHTNGSAKYSIDATEKFAYFVKAYLSRSVNGSIMKQFDKSGDQNVTVYFPKNQNFTRTIKIIEKVTNAKISVESIVCQVGIACKIMVSIQTGSYVNYTWIINNQTQSSTSNKTSPIFTSAGIAQVNVIAYNFVSNSSASYSVDIVDKIRNVSLNCIYNQCVSKVNQNTSFLFYLESGTGYNCQIDFGDKTTSFNFSDQPIDLNNTLINHVFTTEG